jgi:prepilin-type N-terminal cleavage/methylation domain-containing protein
MRFFSLQEKGFTLIELLVVISIIGLLSSVVLSSLSKTRAKSRDARRVQDIIQMRNALELYAQDHGGLYPVNTQGGAELDQFVSSTPGCSAFGRDDGAGSGGSAIVMAAGLVSGKYIASIPRDPKPPGSNKCYVYVGVNGGQYYKFEIQQTLETATVAPGSVFYDIHCGSNCYAIKTDTDPEDI